MVSLVSWWLTFFVLYSKRLHPADLPASWRMPLAVLAPWPLTPSHFVLYRILLVVQATFLAYSGLESADREAAPGANPFAVSPVLELTAAAIGRLCLGPPYSRPCEGDQVHVALERADCRAKPGCTTDLVTVCHPARGYQ